MTALLLGLAAALAWGLHDLLVRRIAPGGNVMGQILVVAAVGAALLALPGAGQLKDLSAPALTQAALAGISYVLAFIGLFRAFGLAPARVVSPVLGAYPLLTMLAAAFSGAEVSPADWLAVIAVVAGVAVTAALAGDEAQGPSAPRAALLWAALGAAGFAATFALGQAASAGDLSLAAGLVTRLSGLACILALLAVQRPSLQPVRRHWRVLIVMGLLDTTALALVMLAGGRPHAEYAAVAASLFGVVTILLAWRVLGERVRPGQWLGIALVFAGIAQLAV